MRKPASLRSALTAALPEVRNEPDRLMLWVEDGAVRARQTGSLGFAFAYPLSVLLREVTTDIAVIALAVVRWLQVEQPDLLAAGPGNSFTFESDILDNGSADVLLRIQLVEAVAVDPRDDGGFDVTYCAEPDPLLADPLPAAGLDTAPPFAGVAAIVAD